MVGVEAHQSPEKTPDGHFVVIKGRKWRATDPLVPDDVGARLRQHLMSARRAVRSATSAGDASAERAARARVQRAKVALGERGTPGGSSPTGSAVGAGRRDSRASTPGSTAEARSGRPAGAAGQPNVSHWAMSPVR